jgi:hypothetical protein
VWCDATQERLPRCLPGCGFADGRAGWRRAIARATVASLLRQMVRTADFVVAISFGDGGRRSKAARG